MSAIPNRKMNSLQSTVTRLEERWDNVNNIGFTHQEFLALFAPPEHWDILNMAASIADVATNGGSHHSTLSHESLLAIGCKTAHLNFYVSQVKGIAPLMPRNAIVLKDISPETMEKITSWVIERAHSKLMFNRVRKLLWWFNSSCQNAHQIRAIWPTIIALAADHEDTQAIANDLRDLKPPKTLPRLPAEVKTACVGTSGLVAAAGLLPKELIDFKAPVQVFYNRTDIRIEEGVLGTITA